MASRISALTGVIFWYACAGRARITLNSIRSHVKSLPQRCQSVIRSMTGTLSPCGRSAPSAPTPAGLPAALPRWITGWGTSGAMGSQGRGRSFRSIRALMALLLAQLFAPLHDSWYLSPVITLMWHCLAEVRQEGSRPKRHCTDVFD